MSHSPGGIELAAALVSTHEKLAEAQDPGAVLLAVSGCLLPFGPCHIDLSLIYTDAAGQPVEGEVMKVWSGGALLAEHPFYGQRYRLSDHPLTRRLVQDRAEPVIVPDVEREPDTQSIRTHLAETTRSLVILPLYSRRHGTWQGILGVQWQEPRTPSEAELLVYRLLVHTLSEALASERVLRELQSALGEKSELLACAERTLSESRTQQTMLGFLLEHLPIGISVFHAVTGAQELVNRAGNELLGISLENELDGYAPMFYRPGEAEPLPQSDWPFTRALLTGQRSSQELEFGRRDGSRFLLDVTATPLYYEGDPAPRIVILYQDITATRMAQREQIAAQEELLRTQALALAERSTPLIPIRDDVLVMPLVGSIDAERGRQILETLVHLGGAQRVRAAIIDVTGAKNLDTAAAHALINAARALRLRGVQPVVTGIQQAAAVTLVQIGVDFSGIIVRATLQDGVEAALRATG